MTVVSNDKNFRMIGIIANDLLNLLNSFENVTGKGENAGFQPCQRQKSSLYVVFILSSANAFKLVMSKFCLMVEIKLLSK